MCPKQRNSPSPGAQHHHFSPPGEPQMLPYHQQSYSGQIREAISLLLLPALSLLLGSTPKNTYIIQEEREDKLRGWREGLFQHPLV